MTKEEVDKYAEEILIGQLNEMRGYIKKWVYSKFHGEEISEVQRMIFEFADCQSSVERRRIKNWIIKKLK
jgi:hypothetical protein